MKRKTIIKIIAVVLILLMIIPVITACNGNKHKMPNTLKIATISFPGALNPYSGSNTTTLFVSLIYEPVFNWDDEDAWYGKECLGDELIFDRENFKTSNGQVKITIKEDAKWSDGTRVTAKDLAFTWDFVAGIAKDLSGNKTFPIQGGFVTDAVTINATSTVGAQSKINNYVESSCWIFNPTNDKELTVQLKPISTDIHGTPLYSEDVLRPLLTSILIIPRHIWTDGNMTSFRHANTSNPIGCGPYKLDTFSLNQSMLLVKNPHYHSPNLWKPEKVFGKYTGTLETAILAVKSGEVDAVYDPVPPLDAATFKKDNKWKVKVYDVMSTTAATLIVNTLTPWGSDPRFREALSLSISQAEMIEDILYGAGTPSGASITTDVKLTGTGSQIKDNIFAKKSDGTYPKSNEAIPQNIEKAKELLKFYFEDPNVIAQIGTYTKNAQGLWAKNGEPFKLSIFNKLDTPRTISAKSKLIQFFKQIGIDGEMKHLGDANASDGTNLKNGGTYNKGTYGSSDYNRYDVYLWQAVINFTIYNVAYKNQFYMDVNESGNPVVPDSSFNYGSFWSGDYTSEKLAKYYAEGKYPGATGTTLIDLYSQIAPLNTMIRDMELAFGDAKLELARDMQQLICGTYYKIPYYSANYLNLYNERKWTGWGAKDNYDLLANPDAFKELTWIG